MSQTGTYKTRPRGAMRRATRVFVAELYTDNLSDQSKLISMIRARAAQSATSLPPKNAVDGQLGLKLVSLLTRDPESGLSLEVPCHGVPP